MSVATAKKTYLPRLTSVGAVKAFNALNKPGLEFNSWDAVAEFVRKETGIESSPHGYPAFKEETGLTFVVNKRRRTRSKLAASLRSLTARIERIERELGLKSLESIFPSVEPNKETP